MQSDWQRHHHARLGFSLELPADWQVLVDEPDLPALLARDPHDDDGGQFPTFLVDVRPLPEPMTIERYELEQQQGLPQQLPGYQCLEISRCDVGGDGGLYRLCDYIVEPASMTGEQWTALRGDDVVTLSAVVRSSNYPELADAFARTAASFAWEGAEQ